MSHFYFHIRLGDNVFEDRRGQELDDLLAAWNYALDDAKALIRVQAFKGPVDAAWVDICDVTGRSVATMPFQRALQTH